ncbi:hypothetical protein AC578_1975 [Pseudocercospora eumusae]|uniref:Uncharacterized protein n=1 Tax=Pseudocercospora eumusae TaxID=321146 RepID=A0A139GTS6_9PEZI|nr:hypothetical protein AC578_1975 [Pseudocercospora eumusae]
MDDPPPIPFYLQGPVWYGAKSHDNNHNTLHGASKDAGRHYLFKWQEVLLFKELEKFKFKQSDWISAFKEDTQYRQTLIERIYPAQARKTKEDMEWFERKLESLLKAPNAAKWHTSLNMVLKYPPPPGVLEEADGEEADGEEGDGKEGDYDESLPLPNATSAHATSALVTHTRTPKTPQQAGRLGWGWDWVGSPSTPQPTPTPTPGPSSFESPVQRGKRKVLSSLDAAVASSSGPQSAGRSRGVSESGAVLGEANATAATLQPNIGTQASAGTAEAQELDQDRHTVLAGLTDLLRDLEVGEKEKAAKAKRKARMRAMEEL